MARAKGMWLIAPSEPADDIAVERALAGALPARRLNMAERAAAVKYLTGHGLSDREIAVRLRWGSDEVRGAASVQRFRRWHGIAPGVPCTRRAA